MKESIAAYKKKLENEICDYMDGPVSERSAESVKHMIHAWMACNKMEKQMYSEVGWDDFTFADAQKWAYSMQNEDGTAGAHWTIEQTTAVGQGAGIDFSTMPDWCWWTAMNMVYSDYYREAVKYGLNVPEYYAGLAKAFLMDKDGPGPQKKLGAYYCCIVKNK